MPKTEITIKFIEQEVEAVGDILAKRLPTFYGNVQFNLQGGICVNNNIHWTTKPRKKTHIIGENQNGKDKGN